MCSFRWLENLLIMTKCKFWKIATSLKEKPQCCKTDFFVVEKFPPRLNSSEYSSILEQRGFPYQDVELGF